MPFVTASDGATIHYRTFGRRDGVPVLLLAGLGSDHHGWLLQRRAFGAAHRCIAVDNRGTGRSDAPPGGWTLEQMADDASQVLRQEGVTRAHVVGASMGGAVAMLLAGSRPELVGRLVLACTSSRLEPWRRSLLEGWVAEVEADGVRPFVRRHLDWFVADRSIARRPPLDRLAARLGARATTAGFVGQCRALLGADDDDPAHRLGLIQAPTLVLVGALDRLTPPADAERLVEGIADARLVTVPRAGHVVMLERAPVFTREVLAFLRG